MRNTTTQKECPRTAQSDNGGSNQPGQHSKPIVTGQCAEVLEILRTRGSVLSLELTADCAIPEAAARVHDLRAMGFNILTDIQPPLYFRGRERRKVALYVLGAPEWQSPVTDEDSEATTC